MRLRVQALTGPNWHLRISPDADNVPGLAESGRLLFSCAGIDVEMACMLVPDGYLQIYLQLDPDWPDPQMGAFIRGLQDAADEAARPYNTKPLIELHEWHVQRPEPKA